MHHHRANRTLSRSRGGVRKVLNKRAPGLRAVRITPIDSGGLGIVRLSVQVGIRGQIIPFFDGR